MKTYWEIFDNRNVFSSHLLFWKVPLLKISRNKIPVRSLEISNLVFFTHIVRGLAGRQFRFCDRCHKKYQLIQL